MSRGRGEDRPGGPDWWVAADGKWYPPIRSTQGSSPVPWVLAGLLLAAGVGFACWWFLIRDDPSEVAGGGGRSYASTAEMAGVLGCTDLAPDDSEELVEPLESGRCTYSGTEVGLSIFEDREHLEQAARTTASFGCAIAESFGIERFAYAVGENWTASPDDNLDDALAEQLASALGGEADSVDC